jgi:hypothetical protein
MHKKKKILHLSYIYYNYFDITNISITFRSQKRTVRKLQ